MAIIWCMVPEIWSVMDKIVCYFGQFFALLPPLRTWKIKTLKLNEEMHGDIIISHMCTINDIYMMYGSWDIEHNRQKFLSFWAIFCPLTPLPLTTQKIKIKKKWKKTPRDIIILHMHTINDNHMMYGSMRYKAWQI